MKGRETGYRTNKLKQTKREHHSHTHYNNMMVNTCMKCRNLIFRNNVMHIFCKIFVIVSIFLSAIHKER